MNINKRTHQARSIWRQQDTRRFAVSFGVCFCVGAIALALFIKTSTSDEAGSHSALIVGDPPLSRTVSSTDERPAASSLTQEDRNRQEQPPATENYAPGTGSAAANEERSPQVFDQSRVKPFGAVDQRSAAPAVNTVDVNRGPNRFNTGSFAFDNTSTGTEQQSSAPAQQAGEPQINDFPATNDPAAADKPMLGKMPRGYTYEQLLYRTWYGWGADNSAQQQPQTNN